jgi:outer membrane protein OmpA-like peptidoglycan-associated protein
MIRILLLLLPAALAAADLPGSQDPPNMKRYAGSEIIGYRAPKFDEYTLPLGIPTQMAPPKFEKSLKVEGQVSRYTYLAPPGRTAAELFRNYKLEFQRLGVTPLFEKGAGERGWFGPTFDQIAEEDKLGQILGFNQAQERLLVGKSKEGVHYLVFVTTYENGVVPTRLQGVVQKDRALALLVVVAPDKLETRMEFVNAAEMSKSLAANGKVALYGIYFDTDKDTLQPASAPTLAEIAKLLAADPRLQLRVVGHTDNQGQASYNLDLSRRRAAAVVRELTAKHGIAPARLDSFGCGLYAPVAPNDTEEGRAKNRRVELVKW